MKKRNIVILLCLFLTSCTPSTFSFSTTSSFPNSSQPEKTVLQARITTSDKSQLFQKTSLPQGTSEKQSSRNVIHIDTQKKYQEVDAFGAALTHSSAHLLMKDKKGNQRKAILEDLFTSQGADFNCIRIPIGASDFHSEEHVFTCCDEKGEEGNLLSHFTLKHDEELIDTIKEIYELKPDLKIIAVPWSAPEWMKVNTHASSEDLEGPKLCGGTLNDKYIDTFADYLCKFAESYLDLGITIDGICFENEPTFNGADYPCMLLSPKQAKTIALRLNSILPEDTKLIAYDHNCESVMYSYLEEEFSTQVTRDIFSGIAIHGYGSQSVPEGVKNLKSLYPEKNVYMTELTEWEHGSSFEDDLMSIVNNTTLRAIDNGLSGTLYWNLALDSNGEPNLGQKSVCYGVVNIDEDRNGNLLYTKRPAYYGIAMMSSVLNIKENKPVYYLKSDNQDDSLLVNAFQREDGYSFVLANIGEERTEECLEVNNTYYSLTLPPHSIYSFMTEE